MVRRCWLGSDVLFCAVLHLFGVRRPSIVGAIERCAHHAGGQLRAANLARTGMAFVHAHVFAQQRVPSVGELVGFLGCMAPQRHGFSWRNAIVHFCRIGNCFGVGWSQPSIRFHQRRFFGRYCWVIGGRGRMERWSHLHSQRGAQSHCRLSSRGAVRGVFGGALSSWMPTPTLVGR